MVHDLSPLFVYEDGKIEARSGRWDGFRQRQFARWAVMIVDRKWRVMSSAKTFTRSNGYQASIQWMPMTPAKFRTREAALAALMLLK